MINTEYKEDFTQRKTTLLVYKPAFTLSYLAFGVYPRLRSGLLTGGSDGLTRAHGVGLAHAGPHHGGLLLEPRAPFLLQLLLDLVDLLRQEVVVLVLRGGGREARRGTRQVQALVEMPHFVCRGAELDVRWRLVLTLLLADSYMSPSTLRA